MPKTISKISFIKNVTIYSTYLIIIWGFYRFLFQLPEQIEELVVKPILWLVPVFFLIARERQGLSSIGFTFKNFFPAVYLSFGLGAIFVIEAVLTNVLKYGTINFGANLGNLPFVASLGISFATAFSEEVSFRGYVFTRLWASLKTEWIANVITTILWTVIHIPIAFFVWKLDVASGLLYLALTAIFGMGSAFIFGRTKNVWGSILLHILWEWPIILFR